MNTSKRLGLALALTVLGVALMPVGSHPILAQQSSVPATPSRPTLDSSSHDSVSFSWADPGDSSITGYQILRRNVVIHAPRVFEVVEDDTGSASTSYVDTSVSADTRYRYRVKARNAHGLSAWSKVMRVTTSEEPVPLEPTPEPTPANQEPTGLPIIVGAVYIGQTLSANTSGISDANGLTGVTYTYQWIRNDGNSDENISDATGQTYTLTDDDLATTIKVKVSFTDDDGYSESLTSAATASVTTLTLVNPPVETPIYQPLQQAPSASVSEGSSQDLPADNTTTGWVIVGDGGATGNLGASDTDAFKINLESGKRYRIDVLGNGPRDHALGGTYNGELELMLRTLSNGIGTVFKRLNGFGSKNPDNTTINNVVNKAGGPDLGARSEFDVTTTDTYMIKVISDGSTGTYTVKASEITSEQAFGDFTSQWNSGRIKIGDTAAMTGNIEDSGDSDWFMATFEAGKCYSIQVRGQHSDSAHDGGTLTDPKLKVMNFYDYYHWKFYDPHTAVYVGIPADEQDEAYFNETYINPSNFELLNRADKVCNMVSPSDQPGDYKLICNYYCDDDSGPGNNSLIKVHVESGGEGDYVIGVEGEGSTGTYSVYVKEITCPSN